MEIKILSPKKRLFEGRADSITLPGENGQFQVLKDHATIFSLLKKGKITLDKDKEFSLSQGMAEVLNNKITVLIKK